MRIDFSRLSASSKQVHIEPRDLFMALPNKDRNYGYPRDVQTEVWKQWFENRGQKDLILKMNTGSGKTVVALTILQSCLNEGKGPAVYVVPDNYLVDQVCAEARKLGIRTACDKFDADGNRVENGEDDYHFTSKKAILVTNIHRLVNGQSVFGLSPVNNVRIGSIVIDDVHACLDTIEKQYTVRIESSHPLYSQIVQRLAQYQDIKDSQGYYELTENPKPGTRMLVPFWIWQKCSAEVWKMLNQPAYNDESFIVFNLPLLTGNWNTCNCVVTPQGIEITPKCISMSKIRSFEQAERRIFMSATLADDSVFVSVMGLKKEKLSNIITPEKANDIGERLILSPQYLNANLNDEEIKQKLCTVARDNNVVVIVPSFERARFWKNSGSQVPVQVLSSREQNVKSGVDDLKSGDFKGITVIVNKYDGIDLPDDACRFLVIDGLPPMRSDYEAVLSDMNPEDRHTCCENIQKIEQGMGRGVRSNNDYCVIILMDNKLINVVFRKEGYKFFSKATREQYKLSQEVCDALMEQDSKPTVDEIFELTDAVIARDKDWIEACRSRLAAIEYNRDSNVDSTVAAMRDAFEKASIDRYDEAVRIINGEINNNKELNDNERGVLMQLAAEYENFLDPSKAQEILLSARNKNGNLLKPVQGITPKKQQYPSDGQEASAVKYIKDFSDRNEYIIHVNDVLDNLVFPDRPLDGRGLLEHTKAFEKALDDAASVLGITSSRPDNGHGNGGPDNLWVIGNSKYLVIECKNGIKSGSREISKSDCNQLLSSIQWFKNNYAGNGFTYCPIMIHRVEKFESSASPSPDMRIMTEPLLDEFKSSVRDFAESAANNANYCDLNEMHKLLVHFNLTGKAIVDRYTHQVKVKI